MDTKNVEMKDESATQKDAPKQETADKYYGIILLYFLELKKQLVLLEKAGKEKDFKTCATLTKNFKKLRKLLSLSDIMYVYNHYLPDLFRRL